MSQLTPHRSLPNSAKLPGEIAVFSPEIEAEVDRHLAKYPIKRSAILPLMFIMQRERGGWLDPPAVAYLAKRLDVQITDIWEVATFYSMINTKPIGKHHIQICKTLSCKLLGSEKIAGHCTSKLGIEPGETTTDGRFSISLVECLGSCGTAPMFQINFDFYENLTLDKVDTILDSLS